MKSNDFEDKPWQSFMGKEVIIVIVVIFSALSFTLGFFVGKSTINKTPAPAAQMEEVTPPMQKQEIVSAQSITHEEIPQNIVSAAEQSRKYTQAEQQESDVLTEKKVIGTVKEASKKPFNETAKQGNESAPSRSKTAKNEIIYTVQLAAFKNASEAENFRIKYNNKGYKTYILNSENKRHEKIYKLRTGEFTERRDAEILSLKLKKTEGISSFVAFKNE